MKQLIINAFKDKGFKPTAIERYTEAIFNSMPKDVQENRDLFRQECLDLAKILTLAATSKAMSDQIIP